MVRDSGHVSSPLPILSSILYILSHLILEMSCQGNSDSRTSLSCLDSLWQWNQCLGKALERVRVLEWKVLCQNSDLLLIGMFLWTDLFIPSLPQFLYPSNVNIDIWLFVVNFKRDRVYESIHEQALKQSVKFVKGAIILMRMVISNK